VLANDADFQSVGKMVGALAQASPASPVTIKIYPLTSITPQRAITSINDLFAATPSGRQTQRVRSMEISVTGPNGPVTAKIDPNSVHMTADPGRGFADCRGAAGGFYADRQPDRDDRSEPGEGPAGDPAV